MKSTRLFPYGLLLFFLFLSACAPASTPAIPLTTRSSGDILYQEEFEDNTTGWARISNDNGIMDYDGGGYRILVRQPKLNVWSTSEKNFGDVRVEADVIKLNGPEENRMGLICRYQSGDYYFFLVSNDGYYVIGKFIGGLTLLLGQSEMQVSEAIQTGTMNHLRADCIGDKLTFYINFTEVASATDTDFRTGDVGVLAGAFTEPGVDVLFDHFVVIQP
jgi:pectate lyase